MKNMLDLSNRFHAAIDNLVALNKELRKCLNPEIKEELSPVEYAIEFCTVTCNIGRRIGKSEYIRRRANELTHSLIIVPTENMALDYDALKVLTADQVIEGAAVTERYDVVFIDEFSFVFYNGRQNKIYSKLAFKGRDTTFILLGI